MVCRMIRGYNAAPLAPAQAEPRRFVWLCSVVGEGVYCFSLNEDGELFPVGQPAEVL